MKLKRRVLGLDWKVRVSAAAVVVGPQSASELANEYDPNFSLVW